MRGGRGRNDVERNGQRRLGENSDNLRAGISIEVVGDGGGLAAVMQ